MTKRRFELARIASFPLLALVLAAAGCSQADSWFCSDSNCEFSPQEREALLSLSDLNLPERPSDRSNKYAGVGNEAAEALGHQFYFEARFSGDSLGEDAIKRPVEGRTPKKTWSNTSCSTCHDNTHSGAVPVTISTGASTDGTNAQPTYNSGFHKVNLWAGRTDSIWAQAAGSAEGRSMNGNRLNTLWVIQDKYRDAYNGVFTEYPLPFADKIQSTDVQPLLEMNGQCKLNPDCPTDKGCRVAMGDDGVTTGCWPRFPLKGKPGSKMGCQPGDKGGEPFGDAYDCMDKGDKPLVQRIMVNWAKAIAAYEFTLVSRDSEFDRYMNDVRAGVHPSSHMSASARRGARLFVGKAACVDCHNGPLLSDDMFYNVGAPLGRDNAPNLADCTDGSFCDCVPNPESPEDDPMKGISNCIPLGVRDGLGKLRSNAYHRDSMWSDDPTDTSGREYWSDDKVKPTDFRPGAWRTASLRDVALTFPYMHNGSLNTLEDVVKLYNAGGAGEADGARSARIKPLYLTDEDMSDLVEFLKTLTGQPLPTAISGKPVLPP